MSLAPAPTAHNQSPTAKSRYVSVAVFAPLDTVLDYLNPPEMGLRIGDWVMVPLGRTKVRGIVTNLHDDPPDFSIIKPVLQPIDKKPVSSEHLAFLLWSAQWNLCPPGSLWKWA